jgi:plastocyanin
LTTHAAAQPKAHRIRRGMAFAPVLIGIVALAGCGSSSKTSSASTPEAPASSTPSTSSSSSSSTSAPAAGTESSVPASTLSLAAASSGQLEYNTKSLSAKAGKVVIDFTNAAPLGHNVTVESSSGQTVGATPTFQGGSKTLALSLKAGTYKFFCSVPGHRQAGMEGTLTVK